MNRKSQIRKTNDEIRRNQIAALPWESGAEDARTPNASRLPGVSEPREASGVRPIYRRFPSVAGRPVVQVPKHGREAEEAFMKGLTRDHAQCRASGTKQQLNIEHSTSNVQRRTGRRAVLHWELDVGCWMLDVLP